MIVERAYGDVTMTPTEAKVILVAARARRLRLAWSMAVVLGGVALLGLAVVLVQLIGGSVSAHRWPAGSDPAWMVLAILAITGACCGGAFAAARRERANLAATGVLLAVALGSSGYLYLSNHGQMLGVQTFLGLLGLFVLLVAVGYLGNGAAVIGTTAGLNIVAWLTLALGIPFPVSSAALAAAEHAPLAGIAALVLDQATAFACIPAVILLQWAVAVVLLVGGENQRQLLRELRTAQVAGMRAQRLADLKDQFIIAGNTDLHAPLQDMQAALAALHSQGNALTPVRRAELVAHAHDIGQRIAQHVAALPDVTWIEQAAPDFAPALVLVRPVVLAAVAQVEEATYSDARRELRIAVPPDLAIWGDAARLQQILTNVLTNATKYTPPETPIEIGALPIDELHTPPGQPHALAMSQSQIAITVRDFGPGIPPDQAPLLFQRFARLPRELATSISGYGLGLYFCRVYAEAMGGRIWLESSGVAGAGTVIHLRLPVPPHRQNGAV